MKALLAVAALGLVGCRGAPSEAGPPDPEVAAVDLLRVHVFDSVDALRPRFVDGLDPGDLPLRLVADGPDQYRFVDVWRLRMVDGRALVSALVELDGEPALFELWLEKHGDRWQVAGWRPSPEGVDPSRTAARAGAQLPPSLAPATFRGAHRAPELRLPAPTEPGPAEPGRARARVNFRALDLSGECDRRTLRAGLRALTPELANCYARALPAGAERGGRLTFEVRARADGTSPEVQVTETTLLVPALSECVAHQLERLAPPREGACVARVPLTFRPRGARERR